MNGAARWLPLVFVLALPAPALAHGPGPGSSLQQERPLPRFGDPRFPRLPDDNADYLMIETEDEDPIQWDWFPGGGVPESGTATGHIRLAYRRGSQAIQAVAHGITYRRSSPSASATETIALAGDVVLATPEGTLFSGRITVVVDNENYRVEA
ncbi:MAG TPA: hypothetical protein VEI97_15960, partial [bacterium]|nr:hypothetical protein [bacterium]